MGELHGWLVACVVIPYPIDVKTCLSSLPLAKSIGSATNVAIVRDACARVAVLPHAAPGRLDGARCRRHEACMRIVQARVSAGVEELTFIFDLHALGNFSPQHTDNANGGKARQKYKPKLKLYDGWVEYMLYNPLFMCELAIVSAILYTCCKAAVATSKKAACGDDHGKVPIP
jgi:hypothetical protein